MPHDFTKAVGYRRFGPRWPLPPFSTGQQRRIVWWCCPDDVKAIPHPCPRGDFRRNSGDFRRNSGDKNTITKREFWDKCTDEDKAFVKELAETFQGAWE